MNLVHLISVLGQEGIRVESAIGADFSPVLIEAARREAKSYLGREEQGKVAFHVAKNETLMEDLSASLGKAKSELGNSFHFILGVNTARYCHRAGKELDCAQAIFDLLAPGGICVVIDMNDRFPLFRSALKNRFRKSKEEECYLPSLEEYAAPFKKVGFDVLRKEHFERMKDGALLANAGHFDVEIDLDDLRSLATAGVREVRPLIQRHLLAVYIAQTLHVKIGDETGAEHGDGDSLHLRDSNFAALSSRVASSQPTSARESPKRFRPTSRTAVSATLTRGVYRGWCDSL